MDPTTNLPSLNAQYVPKGITLIRKSELALLNYKAFIFTFLTRTILIDAMASDQVSV